MTGTGPAPRPLLREGSFLLYWLASAVSAAGSAITLVVAPILVYDLTGSAAITGLLAATEAVPYLVFGLVAGSVTDHADRPRLMTAVSICQGLVLASVPIAAATGHLGPALVLGAAFLSSSLYVWFDAANVGAMTSLVGRERLPEANAILTSTTTILSIVGPAVAGWLAVTIGSANAIAVDAASFLLAAPLIRLVRWPVAGGGAPGPAEPLRGRIADGLRYLWGQPIIRYLTLLGVGNSLTSGAILGLLVVYAHGALGLGTGDSRIGLLFAAVGAGALAASVSYPWLARRIRPTRISVTGYVLASLCAAGISAAPALPLALVGLFAYSASQTALVVNGIVMRQRLTPDRLQGRVNIVARMIAFGGYPFGAAIAGVLSAAVDIRSAYLAAALPVAMSAVIAFRSRLWSMTVPASAAVPIRAADPAEERGVSTPTGPVDS